MKKSIITVATISLAVFTGPIFAKSSFGQTICKAPEYDCYQVKKGESWQSLFPEEDERLIVKKVNRMNTKVHAGMVIAIPKNLDDAKLLDYSPFPLKVDSQGSHFVKVDLSDLAWGAYDSEGTLVNWGPISGGKSYCADVGRGCKTITGNFTIYRKQGPGCVSSRFPLGRGGAPMPYCMHFKGGYALHGSPTVPGYHASHGCVRLFTDDARWLNHDFIDVGATRVQVVH